VTDMNSDLWFVYEQAMGSFLLATAVGFNESGGRFQNFDSKAINVMPKGREGIVAISPCDLVRRKWKEKQ